MFRRIWSRIEYAVILQSLVGLAAKGVLSLSSDCDGSRRGGEVVFGAFKSPIRGLSNGECFK
jgi:hypothetical protein